MIEEIIIAYLKACSGSYWPTYMVTSVPGVGLVEIVKNKVLVEGQPATQEQFDQIKEYFNLKK